MKSCETCIYSYHPAGFRYLECRKMPPVLNEVSKVGDFVLVTEDTWCGEWKYNLNQESKELL